MTGSPRTEFGIQRPEMEAELPTPRMRVEFVFEYTPCVYSDEHLTLAEIAKRDQEAFDCGDLCTDDVDGYESIRFVVEPVGERVTHGRHCTCSSCAREDWTQPHLAPCGMHGDGCPAVYEPRGMAGEVV